jgi:hypothetical protein
LAVAATDDPPVSRPAIIRAERHRKRSERDAVWRILPPSFTRRASTVAIVLIDA